MGVKTTRCKNELGSVSFVYDESISRFSEWAIEDFMDYEHIAWMSPIATEESGITVPYPQNVFPNVETYRVEQFSLQNERMGEEQLTTLKEHLVGKQRIGVVFYTEKSTKIIDFLKNLSDGESSYSVSYFKAFNPKSKGNDPKLVDVCAIFYEEKSS